MNITLHKKSPVEALITLQVAPEDYQPLVKKKLKQYSKEAHIKGFRPGHIPPTVIKQKYGSEILAEELDTLVSEALDKYIDDEELPIIGQPILKSDKLQLVDLDLNQERDFEFEYEIGLLNPFECELSKDIVIPSYKIKAVSQETLDAEVLKICELHGELEEVAVSKVGSMLKGELYHTTQASPLPIEIAVKKLPEEVRAHFVDVKPQDRISFNIYQLLEDDIPFSDLSDEAYDTILDSPEEQEAEFVVDKILHPVPAVLDERFIKEVLEKDDVASVEEYLESLKLSLLQGRQYRADLMLAKNIQATLVEKTDILLPESWIKSFFQEKHDDTEQGANAFYERHSDNLQWRFISQKLIQSHGIAITPEEVVEKVKGRFMRLLGTDTSTLSQMEKQMEEQKAEEMALNFIQYGEMYEHFHEQVQEQRLLDFIKTQITIDVQEISTKAFDELPKNG